MLTNLFNTLLTYLAAAAIVGVFLILLGIVITFVTLVIKNFVRAVWINEEDKGEEDDGNDSY